jgi:predicted 3-demethylubiquinone-9 3-methyltransferase (glyoxalase superfamily)
MLLVAGAANGAAATHCRYRGIGCRGDQAADGVLAVVRRPLFQQQDVVGLTAYRPVGPDIPRAETEEGSRRMARMQKITPFLWFDGNAEEAVNYYVSIFDNSRITSTTRYGAAGPGPSGSVMTIAFELEGQPFVALNGGPLFKFNEAVSFVVQCESQDEVDAFWEKLSAGGGQKGRCGWLKDKFGLSWQVVPSAMIALVSDGDAVKTQRVMAAMMQMDKIDIARLVQASERSDAA